RNSQTQWVQRQPPSEPRSHSLSRAYYVVTVLPPAPERRSDMAKAGKAPMAADEGYCVKCKAKRKISNPQQVKMANGRPALKGVCPVCGTGMFKILPPAK